jgi:3,2-trans-enoyl-CoA isomerase
VKHLQLSDDGGVLVLKLARAKANAMNLDMIEELIGALDQCRDDPAARAVVIGSAQPRFFSSGFDVGEVFAYDRPAMGHFFGRFMDLYESVLRFPKPVIAALAGHTFAGGAFLALACDVRVMAEGDYGFAVNEINFGAVLPSAIRRMAIAAVGMRAARHLILTGDAAKPQRALEIGLVDELALEAEVLARAVDWARKLGAKPAATFAFNKSALLHDAGHPEHPADRESLEVFLDHWFAPHSVELRRVLVAGLKR